MIAAGLIWGLFNVGFAVIFSFGPSMLVERGWSIAAAGSTISIVLWLAVFSVPLGGFLADRTGRPQSILVAGCHPVRDPDAGAAAQRRGGLDRHRARTGQRPAGRTDHEPARARAAPATRAIGMGMFYTVYYAAMMLGPVIGGACAKWAGSAAAAFDFGAAMMLACPADALGLQPDSGCGAKGGVICTSCNRR